MKRKQDESRANKGFPLLFSIIIVFCILGIIVFFMARKISSEMSESAIQNLSESLDLMGGSIEAILNQEAEFQKLMAQELGEIENPRELIRTYKANQLMVKISLVMSGETEGISNNGERFLPEELDFSFGGTVNELQVSQSYLNYMGTWAYTMKCPVEKEGQKIGELYIEYVYDSFEQSLPKGFYDGQAMLYIMDAKSERLVLKPKGIGERDAGHLNLEDFYRANEIMEEELRKEVALCLEKGQNLMFYHDIRGKSSLNYMWSVNDGTIYLIGYVPVEAIQQEGNTVNQNIMIVIAVTLIAFLLCCSLYYFNQRQQNKVREEREREREIHNQQLAEALQAAQIASRSKTMFLSNMSHDIRTPMNAVLGFTSLLARDAENPEKVREYTRKITASGQHLLSLINDILDVSKIESGKVVLNYEPFTLNDLVSSVDAIIRPMAKNKEQEFHLEVRGIQHECLLGDETRVNQVLINLLSNAVKYTQERGNIWFRIIGLKQRSSQFEHIRIEVEDDGFGMTPEYLKTIFDAFTRAENSTTNKVQGTGLGMAITKNIVELMGGTIDVSSEVNRGSLFRVELEFRIPEDQSDRQFWEKAGITRMLAVSYDSETGEDIRLLMNETGVRVDNVCNVKEALQKIGDAQEQQDAYQVILMTRDLPVMDSAKAEFTMAMDSVDGLTAEEEIDRNCLAAAREIRKRISETALILFLSDCDEVGAQELLQIGNAGILTKPFFVSSLKEKILEMQAEGRKEEFSREEEDSSLEGLYFLAAEDNEINAEILTEILKIEGAGCEVAENGKLVVERFANAKEGEFDAILMDVQMPVMNGYDATRAIRKLERKDAATIPIIAMTANAFAEDEKEALEAGMDLHLSKPVDVELLKKVLSQFRKK